MAPSTIPLFGTRVVFLLFCIAGGALGVASVFNAEKKSDNSKDDAAKAVHATGLPAVLDINISDIKRAATATGVGDLGLLVLALSTLALMLLDLRKSRSSTTHSSRALSTKTLPIQLGLFTLATVFTLVTTSVTTAFVATRGADVNATLNGRPVPKETINALAKKLGLPTGYKDSGYLIFLAVAPWVAFLAASTTTVVTWLAYRKSKSTHTTSVSSDEKHTTAHISSA